MKHITHEILGSPRELTHQDFVFVARRLATDIMLGSDTSRFIGPGLEYASSRPYQIGDSVRSINWRLTARCGRPFVKEFEVLRQIPAFLVIDSSPSMRISSTSTSKLELAVWAAAAIALVCLRRMSPVALLGTSATTASAKPSLRENDLWLTLQQLRCDQAFESPGLDVLLERVDAYAKSTSMIIVLSDFYDERTIQPLLRCAQRHDCIALRTIDPAERGSLRAGFVRGREAETGREFHSHGRTRWNDSASVEERLLTAGIEVLSAQTDAPLAPALRRFLSSRGMNTRSVR